VITVDDVGSVLLRVGAESGCYKGTRLCLCARRVFALGLTCSSVLCTTPAVSVMFCTRYDSYGPRAWWWETEELLRKLLLTSVAVLLDPGSPVQVSFVMYLWPCDASYLHVAEAGDAHPLQIEDWLVKTGRTP